MTDIQTLHGSSFSEHLHTIFSAPTGNGAPVSLELVEVAEKETPPEVELFSLFFRGPAAPRLPQQIHTLRHKKMGTLEIFLTAVEGDQTSITYEAVFHRLRQP
ncbi:MAG TPA: hypothetical protein VFY05_10540 [Candidatus Angelobacter sp.]|nr:hypothetical protein [Candidatus Angelobacter sp.]